MSETSEIIFEPNPKQAEFLRSSADILLYGGAAGSGKSYCLLMDALGLNDGVPRITLQHYSAVIIRKNYKDLRDLIEKSKRLYPKICPDAQLNDSQGNAVWKFKSGARIQFSAIEKESQLDSIQGQEYAWIGIDELGTYQDDKIFRYCMSRLRSAYGLKCYMRCTSNPSRFKWLREFFRIDVFGNSTKFNMELELLNGTKIVKRVQYIQAMLKDNPYIGAEYEANLLLQTAEEQNALLHGRWDAYESVDGQVYEHEIKKIDEQRRICSVPFDPALDVYTFWDIGIRDMCVILFVQYVGKEIHIIDKIEMNNRGIKDYIAEINRKSEELGYRYKKHLLPHDGSAREKFSGLSILEQFEQYHSNVECLPRLGIADGILKTKTMLANCWFDNRNDLLDNLRQYKRAWNERLQIWGDPIHDKYSHSADALRYVSYYTPAAPVQRVRQRGSFRGSF